MLVHTQSVHTELVHREPGAGTMCFMQLPNLEAEVAVTDAGLFIVMCLISLLELGCHLYLS